MKLATFEISDFELRVGRNPTATPRSWATLGNRVKQIETDIQGLLHHEVVLGKKRKRARAILKVLGELDRMKNMFDTQCCCEYLRWQNARKVFYGSAQSIKASE